MDSTQKKPNSQNLTTKIVINPPPDAKVIRITGISVRIEERLEHALLIELTVDDTASDSVALKSKERAIGDYKLRTHLNLQQESILAVKLREKHRFRRDKTLANLNLSLEDLISRREPDTPDTELKKFKIHLDDPKKRIWLNFDVPSSTPGLTQDGEIKGLQPAEDVQHSENQTQDASPFFDIVMMNLTKFNTALDDLRLAHDAGLKFGEHLSELNSTSKVVAECLGAIYDQTKVKDERYKEILALVASMATVTNHVEPVNNVTELKELKETWERFPILMKETVDLIEQSINENLISNFVPTSYSKEKFEELKKRHEIFTEEFDRGIEIDSAVGTGRPMPLEGMKELEDYLLTGVVRVEPLANECFEGTREGILDDILFMFDDPDCENVIWIHGAPGSGKSSISLTVKSRLQNQGRFVTYFRFDRNQATITTSIALWRCIAYDLACRLPPVQMWLLQRLRDGRLDLASPLTAFTSLIEAPLLELTDALSEYSHVVIVDGLDECGGLMGQSSHDRRAILQALRRWPKLSKNFKLLVTSRKEADIDRFLPKISAQVVIPSGSYLVENPEVLASIEVSRDIHKFLDSRFRQIRQKFSLLPSDWPGVNAITEMVRRATGNFMWVTTATKFIDSGYPPDQLDIIMTDAPESMSIRMEPLYSLYSTILNMSFKNIASNSSGAETLRAVLGTIIFSQRPLHDEDFTKLPTSKPVERARIEFIRDRLRSVIDQGPALQFVHRSFDDFLLSDACPDKYRIRAEDSQSLLANLCLATMKNELRFNICNLETSCLKNTDIPDIGNKIKDCISGLLSYSCSFWAEHLRHTTFSDGLMMEVKGVIYDKFLYWLEATSLLKETNQVLQSLQFVLSWLKIGSDGEFNDFLRDARRFVGAFAYPIAQSAPHIYVSALPFAPENSLIARHFRHLQFTQTLAFSTGKPTHWSPCIFTSENHKNTVHSIAFSPDEKYFVSGDHNATIFICDSETGNLTSGPFRGPSSVLQAFFDPNGQHVWVNYGNGQIICWDTETGNKVADFQAEGDFWDLMDSCRSGPSRNIVSVSRRHGTVTHWDAGHNKRLRVLLTIKHHTGSGMVAFSPDGCYMASAGFDNTETPTIAIWKLAYGDKVESPVHPQAQFAHLKPISTLSFTADSSFLVCGSQDGTVLVWNVGTGDVVGDSLSTGKDTLDAAAYCHGKGILASASDYRGTIMVWNYSTHQPILGPLEGHTSYIRGLVLSRDGQRALSASLDGTVRMWDLSQKETWSAVTTGDYYTDTVRCIEFSLCGKMFASIGRDQTIRVWDTRTYQPVINPIHSPERYTQITFSPDSSQLIAFGSYSNTFCGWDANTGEVVFRQSFSDDHILHLFFRRTDQKMVTCSKHGVVRIFNLKDGAVTEDMHTCFSGTQPQNTREYVKFMALSPDGMTVLIRDDNRSPRHYLWSTTSCQPLVFDEENIDEDHAAYSPSGRFIVAGCRSVSHDEKCLTTLRVWDIQTSQLVARSKLLDGEILLLAFSPDECHVAFSLFLSSNNPNFAAIWIWSARTGLVSGPWLGHTETIKTLTFSPDGERLVSSSEDGQIRVWSTADLIPGIPSTTGFVGVGTRLEDGWILNASGKLLFWVPRDHRPGLVWPWNVAVIGKREPTQLDLERFKYGENWTESFESAQSSR